MGTTLGTGLGPVSVPGTPKAFAALDENRWELHWVDDGRPADCWVSLIADPALAGYDGAHEPGLAGGG